MKKIFYFTLALGIIFNLSFAQKKGQRTGMVDESKKSLKTIMDTIWYGYGMVLASSFENLEKYNYKLNMDLFLEGLTDCLKNNPRLSIDDLKRVLGAFNDSCQIKDAELRDKARLEAAADNLKSGTKFLLDNKGREGVKFTSSGMQYMILTEGKGPKPLMTDTVIINYSGRTIDGEEFESSYKNGQPLFFPISNMIAGWKEALRMMPEGSKWQIYLPPDLAYGETGLGPVGPNAVLVFDIELLKIIPGR